MMTNRALIILSSVCLFMVCAIPAVLPAQQNPPGTQPGNVDLTGLPAARGIYYHAAPGWVALQSTLLVPFSDGSRVLDFLNLGSTHSIAEIPGPHAAVQIGNPRPTFYLRGITPSELYLVRSISKADYRELWMSNSRNFRDWAHFRAEDVAGVDTQMVAADVVTVQPRASLKPGEYALASVFEPGERWIRLGYDFGLTGRTGQ